VKRVSALDAPEIYSMPLEKMQLPDAQRVVRAALNVG
jgi:pyruvate/2-oxoglutarate/acetoin dehydrogenase E1 component